MIKTIVLDFDGTMGDTCSLIVKTMRQTIARLGLPRRTYEQCAAMIGLPLKETFTMLIPMDGETATLCESTYRELFARNNAGYTVPVFPNVAETIARLHADGLAITIASSRSRHSLIGFLHDMRLEDYISYVVSASDIEHSKPAPDMVLEILRHTGGLASETLVVGDTKYDIAMGRSAGTKTCGVTYGNGKPAELADADYMIDDFGEIMRIVRQCNGTR